MTPEPGRTPQVPPPTVRVERRGAVAVLTLSRPRRHNAMDLPMIEALAAAVVESADDPAVRAVVLTGDGPSFCSGDDLDHVRTASAVQFHRVIAALQRLTEVIVEAPLPIVAALNGPAYGAGLELILACDARIAATTFACAAPEVGLGLLATNGVSVLLPQLVGPARARLMLMSGRSFDVQWSLSSGLVDLVVAPEDLMDVALERAMDLVGGPPEAVAATRRMLNAPLDGPLRAALERERELCTTAHRGAEAQDAIRAWFEQRAAR